MAMDVMAGMVRHVVDRLLSINAVTHVNKKPPIVEPTENDDDIQEISSFVSGPVTSGVSSDFKTGTIGVIQPLPTPARIFIKLTTHHHPFPQ